jgi:hypothetical protein
MVEHQGKRAIEGLLFDEKEGILGLNRPFLGLKRAKIEGLQLLIG